VPYIPIFDDVELPPVESAPEAEHRASYFRYIDPLPDVKPALLWSEDFKDYVRITGMLHPFFPEDKSRFKSASYEARPGGSIVRWTTDGRKLVEELTPGENRKILLLRNSITFMQIESQIRLPEYIALRFNLRITHVHRGLLLGTGPLIDPQFQGNLLIPVHNLTDQDYEIYQSEGLIWIEFTKTSHVLPTEPKLPLSEKGSAIEDYKKWRGTEYYLEKANRNNPIRSSIEGILTEAQSSQAAAERAAKKALDYSRLFATVGFLGIAAMVLTTVVALHQYFGQIGALAQNVQDKGSTALGKNGPSNISGRREQESAGGRAQGNPIAAQ
jgi:deoxycytidine triphosphate deaminase